jgi:putative endonuclease
MEFAVYILYSNVYDKTYVGFTTSIIQRFYSHNYFATKGYTQKYRPCIVVHLEFFQNKTEALKREKWFKSDAGRDFIKEIKKQGFLSAAAD